MAEAATPKLLAGTARGLGLLVLAQVGVGVWLGTLYDPRIEAAHASVQAIRDNGAKAIGQNFHYWGSAVLIVVSALVLAGLLWSGRYDRGRAGGYYGALLLTLAAIGIQVTGNLLPMDSHDVQTAVIESAIAGRTPGVGDALAMAMLGGETFGQATLELWFQAHRWAFSGMAALGALLLALSSRGSKGVFFIALAPVVAAAVLAAALPAPHGPAATPADFTAQDAAVSWYAWPMHGALKAFDAISPGLGWIGSALLPALFVGFLVLAPWLSRRLSAGLVRGVFSLFVLGFAFCAGAFGGLPAPIHGKQDVASASGGSARAAPINRTLAARGLELFNSTCFGCHGKGGVGTRTAPNLTRVFERHPDAEWYKRFIRNPASIKPGTTMPPFRLPDADLAALAEWLRMPK